MPLYDIDSLVVRITPNRNDPRKERVVHIDVIEVALSVIARIFARD
jgi:hypothetical protein